MSKRITFTPIEMEKIGKACVKYQTLEPWNPNKKHSIEYELVHHYFSKQTIREDIYKILCGII